MWMQGGRLYLGQSDVRFLDEVLQAAAERSCQKQVGRFPQHIIDLCWTAY